MERLPTETSLPWTCHWAEIPSPSGTGSSALVWICEYPYRTMRTGPNEDCESCRRAVALSAAKLDNGGVGRPAAHPSLTIPE